MKRKKLKKEDRLKVYSKYDGRCAYCGRELEYSEMQVDHLIPLRLAEKSLDNLDTLGNYMPACRLCNHYKRGNSMEAFRKMIEEIPDKLERDSYIYKVGCRYGNVRPVQKPIAFYFETERQTDKRVSQQALTGLRGDGGNRMKYKTIPATYEAFQYKQGMEFPKWFKEEIECGNVKPVEEYEGVIKIYGFSGIKAIAENDYVMRRSDGEITAVEQQFFELLFEPADDTREGSEEQKAYIEEKAKRVVEILTGDKSGSMD